MNSKKLDQFYTEDSVAKNIVNKLFSIFDDIDKDYLLLEPSAGTGNILKHFPKEYKQLAYDLEPKGTGILQGDFLQIELPLVKTITIGNPPFGKKSSLAIKFFNKCSYSSDVIAFIVPFTFRKWSVQSQLNKDFKLIYDCDLERESFIYNGKPYAVSCCYQIWVKRNSCFDRNSIDKSLQTKPPTTIEGLTLWQHNGTKQSMHTVDNDWDYCVYRQGYKDYSLLFTSVDKEYIKHRMNTTSEQFFFIKSDVREYNKLIEEFDFKKLSQVNISTPGFGKGDFVEAFSKYIKEKLIDEES